MPYREQNDIGIKGSGGRAVGIMLALVALGLVVAYFTGNLPIHL